MSFRNVLGLAVFGAAVGLAGAANAAPQLQIVNSAGALKARPDGGACAAGSATHCEVVGDAGGTSYPWPKNTPGAGAGVPSANGGWPIGPGFATDASFGGAQGTSGWHKSYLKLTESSKVTFQFMGAGDSAFRNSFWLNSGKGYKQLFQDGQSSNPTNPCAVGPMGTIPKCDNPGGGFPSQNQFTFNLGAGLIAFAFDINGGPLTLRNDGVSNADLGRGPGFFLGIDPYLATGTFQNTGNSAYVGLTDRPSLSDHDFQDMGVRISIGAVPEPGTWAMMLSGFGLIGFVMRNRQRLATVTA